MTITNKVSLKSVNGGNTPIDDVVDAPTIGTATAGVESASVTFTAAATGGAATSYGAISTPGSVTGTSATSPITVSGLTGGTAYTFKTYGINAGGTWSNVLSAASNSVTATVATDFEPIATATGTGSSATITFTSIPSTYKHLQLRVLARDLGAGTATGNATFIRLNNNTGSNYSLHSNFGDGATLTSGGYGFGGTGGNGYIYGITAAGGNTAGLMGVGIIDILDYTNTSKLKTYSIFSGIEQNGTGVISLTTGMFNSTAAITRIDIQGSQGSFTTTSVFSLYGLKG